MAHELLRSQENDVFRALQEADLDPDDFDWRQSVGLTSGTSVPLLVHAPSGFWFSFDFANQHYARYSPGQDRLQEERAAGTWDGELGYVRQWLAYLKREYYAPNLWDELAKQRELTKAATGSADAEDNRPFTLEEQTQIAQQLGEIKALLIRTEQLDGERERALGARIEYLADASTRLGRRDWLTIFYGAIFAWALDHLISPDGVRQVIMLAAHGFGHLFGASPGQLMP